MNNREELGPEKIYIRPKELNFHVILTCMEKALSECGSINYGDMERSFLRLIMLLHKSLADPKQT